MNASYLQIGQVITAAFFFRCGQFGGDLDYRIAVGSIIRKLECFNKVLVEVDREKSYNCPTSAIWIDCDKAEISINV